MKIKIVLATIMLCFQQVALAQEIAMADQFRADGKIYVVIAVFAILLVGFFSYLFTVDRKISRLENDLKSNQKNEPS